MYRNLLAALLFGLLFLTACSEEKNVQEEKVIPVNVFKVQPDKISTYIRLTGNISGENDAAVFSKISEKIDKIYVKPGQHVNSGQVLAVQHNALLKQSVDLAAAAVKNAQAQYNLLAEDFNRMDALYRQRALSQQQFDQIKTQKETAGTGLEQANLQLEQAKENYQNSFIKAPFSGVVGAIFIDKDQMVPAGQPVVRIVSSTGMKSKLNLPEKNISLVSKGQPVVIKFPSVPGKEYEGKVTSINHSVDPVSNLLEIEVQLINPDNQVRSGIFGEFLIETSTKNETIVLPENALMQQTEIVVNKKTGLQKTVKKYFVYTVENSTAMLTEVKTGLSSDGRIEIINGLNNSDTIIVVGQNIVRDGQKIKVVD